MKEVSEIKGFEVFTNYMISEDGRLYNKKTKKFRAENKKREYIIYTLTQGKHKKTIEAHKLVALAFLDNDEEKTQIDHVDGNRYNNHYTNLRYVTASENQLNRKNWNKKKYYIIAENKETKDTTLFKTITEACEKLNVHSTTLYKIKDGFRKSTKGYFFYFVERNA